jgi:hypothetical protein
MGAALYGRLYPASCLEASRNAAANDSNHEAEPVDSSGLSLVAADGEVLGATPFA